MPTLTLDYTPYEYQQQYHTDTSRFTAIAGGRRVGKSKMALMEAIKHCLQQEKAVVWWVAPTLSVARDVGWNEFKEISEVLSPILDNVNETRMEVRFANKSTMTFKGADNEASLRGRGLTFLVMDEAAFIQPDIWSKVLRPALSDKAGKALLISTPNGKNWFYEVFYRANTAQRKIWSAYHWPTPYNPLITEEELQDAAQDIDELSFRQEYLAEFITREGMVYSNFSEANVIASGLPSVHEFDIYLGMDFGFANPSAICFMAVDKANQIVYQFDEIYAARTPIDALEMMILEKLGKWGMSAWDVKAIYCDPAGNAAELTSGISPVDELRRSPRKWTVKTMKSEIMPGVNLVRSFIQNARGERRYFITNNCHWTLESFNKYTYAPKSKNTDTIKEEPLKDGKYDHMMDAVRYFFVNHFDKAKWVGKVPTFIDQAKTKDAGPVLKKCINCKQRFVSHTARTEPPHKCKGCLGEITYV